jgi:branched-chain amino acid transport system ATP-binding protein
VPPQSEVVLEVQDIVSGYGDTPIVKGMSVTAWRGCISVLVGPNGAGKSTLMKTIMGLVRATSGTVAVGGDDVSSLLTHQRIRRGIGYVPQLANVFPSLTVRENLEMGAYSRRSGMGDKLDELLGLFPDLKPALPRRAGHLSGGQRNMLALARALVNEPRVLLVDEPTAGLSPKYENAVWEHLLTVREHGVGILAVEQNTRRALSHADRAYLLVLGECRMEGPGADLLADKDLVSLYIGQRPSHGGVKAMGIKEGNHKGEQ